MTGPQRDLPRTIGFWGATGVMVGIVIGSGVFAYPPSIARETGSPTFILLAWLIGGVLALFGAFTYAELAVRFPESGGVYVFLREGYGRALAFVFGWTYVLLAKPLAAAGIAIVFAEQFNRTILGMEGGSHAAAATTTSVALVILTVINVCGMRLGSGVAGALTVLKVGALLAIIAAALVLQRGNNANFISTPHEKGWWLALAPIMAGVMWTYDGWSDVGSIAGEVRDPQRQLPRIYVAGTAFLIALYVAINAVYIWLVPLDEMRGAGNIAPLVMQRLVGDSGALAIATVVIISTLGSTHGAIITGARITYAQARDGLLFRSLGHVHPRFATPDASLWVQLVLSCAAVWVFGNFEDLAGGFVFTMWIFYGLAGAVIFIDRRRYPDAPRAYRCWGYPVVPGLFVMSAAAMTVLTVLGNPGDTWKWGAGLAAGFPVYYAWNWWTGRHAPRGTIGP